MKPWVSIVSGITIDGKIAPAKGVSSKHTMPLPLKVRVYLHTLRSKFDAISVGCNTVRLDNPRLRVEYTEGKNPIRVIPCNRVDISPDMNVFKPPGDAILVVPENTDRRALEAFIRQGVKILVAGRDKIDLKVMLGKLYELGIKSLMVEGGSKLNGSLLALSLVDELVIIHHPMVVFSKDAPSFAEAMNVPVLNLKLVSSEVIEGYLITRWIPEGLENRKSELEYLYASHKEH